MDRTPSPDEFIEQQLGELKASWGDGYYPAAIEALGWCVLNERPLPPWLGEAANAALQFAFDNAGAGGNKRKGGFRAQASRADIHEGRWRTASHWLDHRELLPEFGYPATRDGAFAFASELLAGSTAQGSPGAIETSFDMVQGAKKATPAI